MVKLASGQRSGPFATKDMIHCVLKGALGVLLAWIAAFFSDRGWANVVPQLAHPPSFSQI